MKISEEPKGRLMFASDYQEGAHPAVLRRLTETNGLKTDGYGTDPFCEGAREKIRAACGCPGAAVHFFVGGTQANATVIDGLLASYQGVIAAASGHISTHEAGAVEFGGHKVLTLPPEDGKITAAGIDGLYQSWLADESRDHMVMPGMVYISQPTESGTLYSLGELTEISRVCRADGLPLYVDGARLAHALACPSNDVTLGDLARLTDAFCIGGTKCGALFGEAVVAPDPALLPHFFTVIKQHGALLAKGRLLGVQFDALFSDGLYLSVGRPAAEAAETIRRGLSAAGFRFAFDSPTNQVFPVVEDGMLARLSETVGFTVWSPFDEGHTVIRLATSWATAPEEVTELLARFRAAAGA